MNSGQPPARGRVTVDLAAIAANYQQFALASQPGQCAAVVKANAYGLGMEPIAQRLNAAGCQDYFVATVAEGMALRDALPQARIYIFDGFDGASAPHFVSHRLIPVLNTAEQHVNWVQCCQGERPVVWHVDTGMIRLGMSVTEAAELAAKSTCPPTLLLTHMACADEPGHPHNRAQAAVLGALRARLPQCPVSIGNTAGCQSDDIASGDLTRVGIGLFGCNPLDPPRLDLTEVVQVHGSILQTLKVPAGTPVGYGATFVTERASTLLTIGVGYADGYLRALSNAGWARLGAFDLPVVGRVSMDYIVVDASAVPADTLNGATEVALLGAGVDANALATAAGTISYELLTRLGSRLPVQYCD